MAPGAELAILSFLLLAGTLAAAWLSLRFQPAAHQTDTVIAFAAGVLLGTAFFHLLPEALHARGPTVLLGVAAGAAALFALERFLRERAGHHGGVEVHEMMHTHAHDVAGLAAFIGLSVHTLSDGFALSAAIGANLATVVFVAIFAHQLPTAFSLSALLRRGGRSKAATFGACAIFGVMVPVGGGLYLTATQGHPETWVMPWALAFSTGNFLHLALADLLPDLTRSGARRTTLAVLGLVGFGGMGLLRLAIGD